MGDGLDRRLFINLKNTVELVNPPDRLLLSIFSCLSCHPFGALKTAAEPSCRAHDATEWLMTFRASGNAARRRRVADAVFRINAYCLGAFRLAQIKSDYVGIFRSEIRIRAHAPNALTSQLNSLLAHHPPDGVIRYLRFRL